MQIHKFYKLYANVPLSDRLRLLSFKDHGLDNLEMVYKRVDAINDLILPLEAERQKLIDSVEDYINAHQA